jgi:hypothetical protein
VIRFSAAFVAVAAVLLVAGIITSDLKLVYVAIGVSSVALLALAIGWFLNRDKLSASSYVAESVTGSASAVPEASVPVAAEAESVASRVSATPGPARVPAGLGGTSSGSGSVSSGLGSAPPGGAPWGPASGAPETEAFAGAGAWPSSPASGTSWTGSNWGDAPISETFTPFVPEPAAVEQPSAAVVAPSPDPEAVTRIDAPTEASEAESFEPESSGAESFEAESFEAESFEAESFEAEAPSADVIDPAGSEEPSSEPGDGSEHADGEVDDLAEPAADGTPADGAVPVDAPAEDAPADEVEAADGVAAADTAEADSADGSGSGAAPEEATLEAPDPTREVTVVPGVPRYHDAGCILIRFMGENDLEKKTLGAAAEGGCTPCRACLPD